ncbi:hypothetical protein LV779_16935 [Streptomyces thinghirensis]|nr:hypothetical protein [Streptomyces thinghirensis]
MQAQPQPQAPSRRIRPRRLAAIATVTVVTFAASTSAGTGRLAPSYHGVRPRPGRPLPLPSAHGPCMISGGSEIQMSEGVPTSAGYARPTGTVRALTLMIDFSDAPGEVRASRPGRGVLPADRGMVPHQLLRPPRLPARDPDPGLAAHAEVVRRVRHRTRRPFDPGYRSLVQDLGGGGRRGGGLPVVRPPERAGHPERGPLRPGHESCPSPSPATRPRSPTASRCAQRVLRLLPPGRRLRLLRRDRLPGPAPREQPRLRPPRPLHPGGRRGRRPLGHHERGLGRQQRPPRLAQVETGLARPSQVHCSGGARHDEYTLGPAGRQGGGDKLVVVPLDGRSGYAVELQHPREATTRRCAAREC